MCESRKYTEEAFRGCPLTCRILPMGQDYTLAVYGGTLPHVGSVVMAQARPSLAGDGRSATSSVLNGIGHKDEAVARMFAEAVAIRENCTAVCACGIHMDEITAEQLRQIQDGCRRLLEKCLEDM